MTDGFALVWLLPVAFVGGLGLVIGFAGLVVGFDRAAGWLAYTVENWWKGKRR